MGFWSGCQNVGNILGLEIAEKAAEEGNLGWSNTLLYSSILIGVSCLLIALLLKPYPERLGILI